MRNRFDPTAKEIRHELSTPLPRDAHSVTRRRFLQATGAVGALSLVPTWLASQAEAVAPIGANDGILVLITLDGGCDGLTMVAPINDGAYHAARAGLAIPASSALGLNGYRGLHPDLKTVKAMWDTGQVAVIEGVGDHQGNLSHFESLARLETAKANNGAQTSGWLGRYMDGLGGSAGLGDPFHGIAFGYSVPLVTQGRVRRATVLPRQSDGFVVRSEADPVTGRQLDALSSFANSSSGFSALGDDLARSSAEAINLAGHLAPQYSAALPDDDFVREMALTARLINANLGIRVVALNFGDFDGHANHMGLHNDGLARLDAGLAVFFQTLRSQYSDQTMVLTTTEFGRRVKANNSGGTDHGAATTYLAIGSQINGGMYGQMPSLTSLDDNGNLIPEVDYRSVYGTVLDSWLSADQSEVLGDNYENLGFTSAPATKAVPPPPAVSAGLGLRDQVFRLYRAYFRRNPDSAGIEFWVGERRRGVPIDHVSNSFAASDEFKSTYGALGNDAFVDLVYGNVLGRAGDAGGRSYWIGKLNSGTSRGRVMLGFSDSPEFTQAISPTIAEWDRLGPVARLYHAYFLRRPDAEGLTYWTSTGRTVASISQAFSVSPEFGATYGALSDAAFIDLVYANVMNRPAEQAGRGYWISRLGAGATRGSVMAGFSESQEFVARFATLA